MIDVGFNLLIWAVRQRKSIKFIDGALRSRVNKANPYIQLRVTDAIKLDRYKPDILDLASGMGMGRKRPFMEERDMTGLIGRVIHERAGDCVRIKANSVIRDKECVVGFTVSVKSKKGSLQMTVDCKARDFIYKNRQITQMRVCFWVDETPIVFEIEPGSLDHDLFFNLLSNKVDYDSLVRGCRVFCMGPDELAAYIRETWKKGACFWKKSGKGNRKVKDNGHLELYVDGFNIPETVTFYQANHRGESYSIVFQVGKGRRWLLEAVWFSRLKFSAQWVDKGDLLLQCILQNDYDAYDNFYPGLRSDDEYEISANFADDSGPIRDDWHEESDAPKLVIEKASKKSAKKPKKQKLPAKVEDLTSYQEFERPVEHVRINDLIVRSKYRTCWDKEHEIREVIAVVCIFSPTRGVVEVAVDAFCCPQCRRYYVLQKTFDRLQNKGAICCKIITKQGSQQDFLPKSFVGLSDKSLYRSLGYNANAEENLSDRERRAVLDFVIENGFRTQKETIGFIQHLIDYNGRGANMGRAVEKWESDIEYLVRSKDKKTDWVKIDRIFLTQQKKWK